MKIVHMAPENMGFNVEGSYDHQVVVAVLEDGGIQVGLIVDKVYNACYINEIIDKNAIWKFSYHNFKKVEDDKAFEAYRKFFYDNGLGVILDGIGQSQLSSIKGINYGARQ